MPTGQDVADFLGRGSDPQSVAVAEEAVGLVTVMARAYTRGKGFDGTGYPNDEISAVITTATARLVTNPQQLGMSETVGSFSRQFNNGFTGWTLVELFVLNRYRVRAG